MTQLIAILEDDERRIQAMRQILRQKLPKWSSHFFDNAPDMIVWLKEALLKVSLISLDHDLGQNRERNGEIFDPGIGRNVVDFLVTQKPICPVIIHTTNMIGGEGMKYVLSQAGWYYERVVPFGDIEWIEDLWIKKLLATIKG
jgi:hypothetical protein